MQDGKLDGHATNLIACFIYGRLGREGAPGERNHRCRGESWVAHPAADQAVSGFGDI